ncbi:MAG: sulfatase-like hydrolase/transferase [Pseudomonadota bacterium]
MPEKRPPKNMLFIMSDEHNADFMGCAGHSQVQTPTLDRLAARGSLFDSAYTNCPICVPARASFATGRYVHDCGYWDNADPYDGKVQGWGHRLQAQGHKVVSIGKLHYRSTDDATGFDEEIIPLNVVDGIGDLIGLIRDDTPERKAVRHMAADVGRGESTYTGYDRNIAAEAARWLQEDGRTQDKPWCLFVSFVCPHFPLIAPEAFYDLYDESTVDMPQLYDMAERPDHPYYQAFKTVMAYDKYFDEANVRRAIVAYMGMVSFLDANIAQVLSALETAGLTDETRVIYTSDHGEALGKRGFWGKSTMFEESARIPLIMAGPDIAQGQRVATPVTLVDSHPTILACVGAKPDAADGDLPGQSLFDIADKEHDDRVAFSEYHAAGSSTANYMIRKGRYKLVAFVGMPSQLFDLEADPDETTDLAGDPTHAETVALLEAELRLICDPEAVDRQARADQQATIEKHGGREAILSRGDFGYSPAPGQTATFSS